MIYSHDHITYHSERIKSPPTPLFKGGSTECTPFRKGESTECTPFKKGESTECALFRKGLVWEPHGQALLGGQARGLLRRRIKNSYFNKRRSKNPPRFVKGRKRGFFGLCCSTGVIVFHQPESKHRDPRTEKTCHTGNRSNSFSRSSSMFVRNISNANLRISGDDFD